MPKFLLESNKFISGELQGKNVVEKLIRHKLCTTFAIAFFFHVAVIQSNASCYFFGPGLTIRGADYRRDYGLSQGQCAKICKSDSCCMGFEWQKELTTCTLKSRSLNGTVTTVTDDVYFGICLDYGDNERDRLWDHEIIGQVLASMSGVEREKCANFCKASVELEENVESADYSIQQKYKYGEKKFSRVRAQRSGNKKPVVIYNWQSDDPLDMDAQFGRCECISLLHGIRISYGSFSGFMI